MKVKVIGLGGIGSILADKISRFLKFTFQGSDVEISLVDGDEYEDKNLERQDFHIFGNKAESKERQLKVQFENLTFSAIPQYIGEDNISEIVQEGDIIFLAVDNHKTRKLVNDRAKTLKDIIIISGGNELTDGNVQLYARKEGKDITPHLTAYHPEIEEAQDKLPQEMSCQELEASEPQLYFTNLSVATIMCQMFRKTLDDDYSVSEVYFDIDKMTSRAVARQPV